MGSRVRSIRPLGECHSDGRPPERTGSNDGPGHADRQPHTWITLGGTRPCGPSSRLGGQVKLTDILVIHPVRMIPKSMDRDKT